MLVREIPAEEVDWVNNSFVDPNGRVFEWRGGIYRALEPAYLVRWRQLVDDGTIPALLRDGLLIESELTDLQVASGNAVLCHRRVPVVSYCFEWLPKMLKEAALLTLDLCIRLAEKKLTLQDGHPWNILFDGTRPIYVDAGSIVPARDDILWAPYQQFCNFFLFPLYLYATGRDHVARCLLRDYLYGVTDSDLLATLSFSYKLRHPRRVLGVALPSWLGNLIEHLPEEMKVRLLSILRRAGGEAKNHRLKIKFFESVQNDIAALGFPRTKSHWARYYGTPDHSWFRTDLVPGDWQRKQETVTGILTDLRPKSVLDVGANTGHYAKIAAVQGARVTACELDVAALTVCYEQARKDRLDILPLVTNVLSTSPAAGRGAVALSPAIERLRSDLVMGLAVVHHMVAAERIRIKRLTEIFAAVTNRWLLLEFVPPLHPKIGASPVPGLDDFTAGDLQDSLKTNFASVRSFASYPHDRQLFVCEK